MGNEIKDQSSSTDHIAMIDRVGRFKFKSNIYFDIESAGDGWIMLSNSDSRLCAVGKDIEEAKKRPGGDARRHPG